MPSPVPPGSGWPGDPAEPGTAAAGTPAAVRRLAATVATESASTEKALAELDALISCCRACPRLVEWREGTARDKRAAYADQPYWGRPVTGWGVPAPPVLIVGLAPAAHGGNRTGRIFTGDRSGDWLWASMHRVGLAAQATSDHAGDGQAPIGCRLSMAVHCAPPDNKPTTVERATCSPWFEAELALLAQDLRVLVALGSFGWDATLRTARTLGWQVPRPKPRFGHGAEAVLGSPGGPVALLGCFHPSQQNTFTGRLSEPMLDDVLGRAAAAATMPR